MRLSSFVHVQPGNRLAIAHKHLVFVAVLRINEAEDAADQNGNALALFLVLV
jgi:hypothetical protein